MAKYTPIKKVMLVREGRIENERITASDAASRFACRYSEYIGYDDQEHFSVALLDTKHNVLGVVKITTGTLDASLVHPREVFRPAIVQGASVILLIHNHPSGDPTPSQQDIAVTERLIDAGKLIGIGVLDHIVVGDHTNQTASIRELHSDLNWS